MIGRYIYEMRRVWTDAIDHTIGSNMAFRGDSTNYGSKTSSNTGANIENSSYLLWENLLKAASR